MRYLMLAALLLGMGCASPAGAQRQEPEAKPPAATASEGGQAVVEAPRPVEEASDPANARSSAETTDGLALVITIDRDRVTLDSATLARVPRGQARPDRKVAGDVVRAQAYSAGQLVSSSVAPDNVVNALEGGGLVRNEKRQIVMVLATDRPVDRVDIAAEATNAKGTLDVRSAYAEVCRADPKSKWCQPAR